MISLRTETLCPKCGKVPLFLYQQDKTEEESSPSFLLYCYHGDRYCWTKKLSVLEGECILLAEDAQLNYEW